jgi:adenylylsulfate kinase
MSVVWITGLPSAGKSTLALRLHAQLARLHRTAIVLDGDEVRRVLGMTSYEPAARDEFYRALAELAALIARQGPIAIVAATAPARAHREHARELVPHLLEVFVATPEGECARRDTKGLYAASRRGELLDVPGAGAVYEPPSSPDVIAHGGEDAEAITAIVRLLERRAA